jgi:excisionase family DNA binding protein
MVDLSNYLTVIEATKELGVNDSRVRQLIREGKLSAIKRGRDWLISKAEIERYKESKEKDK